MKRMKMPKFLRPDPEEYQGRHRSNLSHPTRPLYSKRGRHRAEDRQPRKPTVKPHSERHVGIHRRSDPPPGGQTGYGNRATGRRTSKRDDRDPLYFTRGRK